MGPRRNRASPLDAGLADRFEFLQSSFHEPVSRHDFHRRQREFYARERRGRRVRHAHGPLRHRRLDDPRLVRSWDPDSEYECLLRHPGRRDPRRLPHESRRLVARSREWAGPPAIVYGQSVRRRDPEFRQPDHLGERRSAQRLRRDLGHQLHSHCARKQSHLGQRSLWSPCPRPLFGKSNRQHGRGQRLPLRHSHRGFLRSGSGGRVRGQHALGSRGFRGVPERIAERRRPRQFGGESLLRGVPGALGFDARRWKQFVSNGFAVYVHSESVSVSENLFRDNGYGLYVFQQGNATIDGNQFSAFGGQGVVLWGSQRNRIRANRFNYSGVLLEGTTVNAFDSHEIASSNLVNGKPLRYYHDCGPISLDGQPTGQLLVSNCTAFAASNLTIGQTDVAVELAYVHDAVLEHNVLWGSSYGLRLIASSGVVVTHNSFALNSVQVSGRDRETWDAGYPSGGNYWSDYGGGDDCSGTLQDVCPDADGIGDTPYTVSIAGVDRYPTTRPFNALPLPLAASL